eukprot:CAMPEP_0172529498 /NCGR_PEP_ID=MMETSP1067-20121228/3561_1 /TAXON_ID=265564 ORGANISM="Thalassiosira punctigera, Strain Tpunct2005C2" /NCGR_SAMPLE_ID=MMETSP1067 /ASSEMBLY_ACC=CAM_ASM_000444 /LENGTH=311 /DNA_ID=CAMNT_0013313557 /DNA_START=113 /DNA_END=1048 /DNA_ORIENTATION=+
MASRSKPSVISKGTIHIGHLEREIKHDVATYRQYKAEDEMKKRAIHVSKDYDEFRNFVSASQLKPTSGREVSSLFSGASGSLASGSSARSRKIQGGQVIGGLGDIIQRRKDTPNLSISMKTRTGNIRSPSIGNAKSYSKAKAGTHTTKTSRAAHDFLREWKQHCITAKDTLSFLTRIHNKNESCQQNQLILQPDVTCKEYFSTDIDSEIVGDVVEALHLLMRMTKSDDSPTVANINSSAGDFLEGSGMPLLVSSDSNSISFIQDWLKALQSCDRFDLSISFLMPDQQLKLKELRNFLKSSDGYGGKADHFN